MREVQLYRPRRGRRTRRPPRGRDAVVDENAAPPFAPAQHDNTSTSTAPIPFDLDAELRREDIARSGHRLTTRSGHRLTNPSKITKTPRIVPLLRRPLLAVGSKLCEVQADPSPGQANRATL